MEFLEMFQYAFIRNAFYAAFLASLAASVIGSFIVVKRIVFITGGMSHAAFGGIGIAHYLGTPPMLGAAVFGLFSAGVLGAFDSEKTREDSSIGILWAVGMAVGIIFIYLTPGYSADLFSYLFGNILMVTSFDIKMMLIVNAFILTISALCYNQFVSAAFDGEFSKIIGVKVRVLNIIFLCLTALTIVLLIRVSGIILLMALLIIPPSAAMKFSSSLKKIMILSFFLSLIFTTSGIIASYYLNLPAAPVIILISAISYLVICYFSPK